MKLFAFPQEIFSSVVTIQQNTNALLNTVITALDQIVLTQDRTPPSDESIVQVAIDHDLTVFADGVVIRGPISAPERTITIFARTISAEANSARTPASISVSGVDASPPPAKVPQSGAAASGDNGVADISVAARKDAQPGQPGAIGATGQKGGNGTSAGSITIFTESFDKGTGLLLSADGGAGGRGQDGQDGQTGGTGGNGACASVIVGGSASSDCRPAAAGGPAGAGGPGGTGGNGGDGGTISASFILDAGAKISISTAKGKGGTGGTGGQPGAPGNGGTAAIDCGGCSVNQLQAGAKGPGAAVGGTGDIGLEGKDGIGKQAQGSYNQLAANASIPQLLMVLTRTRLAYLSLDPSSTDPAPFKQLVDDLLWLGNLTALYAATPAPTVPGKTSDEVAQIAQIYNEAEALFFQFTHHLDFYGHPYSFVPRESFNSFTTLLNQLIRPFTELEVSFNNYFTSLTNQQAQTTSLGKAESAASRKISDLTAKATKALSDANQQVAVIEKSQKAVDDYRQVLQTAITKFEQQILAEAQLNSTLSCTLDMVIKGIGAAATITGDEDLQQAKKIVDAVTSVTGTNTNVFGVPAGADEKVLVHKLDLLNQSVQSFKEGFTANLGLLTLDDPHGYKILAAQSDLDNVLEPFLDIEGLAQEVKVAMQQFVKLVLQLNSDVLAYNAALAKMALANAAVAQLQAEVTSIHDALESNSNPTLPGLVAFMSKLYQDLKMELLSELYLANRALAFWSLDLSYSSFFDSVKLGSLGDSGSDLINAQIIELLGQLQAFTENRGSAPQQFEGIIFKIDKQNHLELINALIANNRIDFTIPPALPATTVDETPFPDFANVRITKARARIKGASTEAGTSGRKLHVRITHGSRETIVKTDGTPVVFDHATVKKNFIYDIDTGVISEDADFGVSDETATFALLGPFTNWTIEVLRQDNTNLVLDGVTEVEFEFFGTNFTFSQGRAPEPIRPENVPNPSKPGRGV